MRRKKRRKVDFCLSFKPAIQDTSITAQDRERAAIEAKLMCPKPMPYWSMARACSDKECD